MVLYRSLHTLARQRKVSFSDETGGNVRLDSEISASHFSSYGTSKTAQTFADGLHYVEILVEYRSHYCGIGVISNDVALPEAGRGAWLSPAGAQMWVSGSGFWGSAHHRKNSSMSFKSGDKVGVLLNLAENERTAYWYLNGTYTETSLDLLKETDTSGSLAFVFCIGDGSAEITRTYLPDELPEDIFIARKTSKNKTLF